MAKFERFVELLNLLNRRVFVDCISASENSKTPPDTDTNAIVIANVATNCFE